MSRTLLVIDDDVQLCATLVDAFGAADLEVVTATTLAQGLAVCRTRQVDVVLLDQHLPDGEGAEICPAILKMPGMSGFELMRQLGAHHPHLPVVVMTAFFSPEIERELTNLAPVAVLEKPVDLDELIGVITRTLSLSPPAASAAGLTVAMLVLMTMNLAVGFPAVLCDAWFDRLDQAEESTDTQPAPQNWRIAICSDPRA